MCRGFADILRLFLKQKEAFYEAALTGPFLSPYEPGKKRFWSDHEKCESCGQAMTDVNAGLNPRHSPERTHISWVYIGFSIGPNGGVRSNGNRACAGLWPSSPVVITSPTNGTICPIKPRAVYTAGKGAESLAVSSMPPTDTTALAPALNSVAIVSHNATPTDEVHKVL